MAQTFRRTLKRHHKKLKYNTKTKIHFPTLYIGKCIGQGKHIMKKLLLGLALGLSFAPVVVQAKTELLVYTAVETELMPLYKNAFEKAHPDIGITWVRDSTGIITARLLAEKDAPKADVVFGLNVTSILVLDGNGLLDSYTPKGAESLPDFMRDKRENPTWAGMSGCPAAICVNKNELAKLKLPMPETWEDLTAPAYREHIVMSNPVSSGAAYSITSSWLQAWGEEKGWDYMTRLDANIDMYTQSGSRPAEMAARGETVIGISEAAFARTLVKRGAPLDVVILGNPMPLDLEASAIVKGTKNLDAARKLLDFSISSDMAKIVGARSCITASPDATESEASRISDMAGQYDFSQAAEKRQETIEAWRARFDGR